MTESRRPLGTDRTPRFADNYRAPEQNEGMNLLQPQNGTFSQVFGPGRRFQPTKTHTPPTPPPKWHKMPSKQDGKHRTVNNLKILHSCLLVNTHAHFCPVFWQNQALLGPRNPILPRRPFLCKTDRKSVV